MKSPVHQLIEMGAAWSLATVELLREHPHLAPNGLETHQKMSQLSLGKLWQGVVVLKVHFSPKRQWEAQLF